MRAGRDRRGVQGTSGDKRTITGAGCENPAGLDRLTARLTPGYVTQPITSCVRGLVDPWPPTFRDRGGETDDQMAVIFAHRQGTRQQDLSSQGAGRCDILDLRPLLPPAAHPPDIDAY